MSQRTAVYRLFNDADVLLYVGISKHFGARWTQHATQQPWWPEVHHQTITWYDSREAADDAETEAIAAEHPLHNVAKVPRLPAPTPAPKSGNYLSTPEVAELARISRATVDREIRDGHLAAEKVGRIWVVDQAEAERWAAQFRPYTGDGRRTGDASPVKHASPA